MEAARKIADRFERQDPRTTSFLLDDPVGAGTVRKKFFKRGPSPDSPGFSAWDATSLDKYRSILKNHSAVTAQRELGMFLLSQGLHDAAIRVIEGDVKEKIDSSVFENLGSFHLQKNNITAAGDAFRRMSGSDLEQKREAVDGKIQATSARFRDGSWYYSAAHKEIFTDDPSAQQWSEFAVHALAQGNYKEAEAALKKAHGGRIPEEINDIYTELGYCAFNKSLPLNGIQFHDAANYFAQAKNTVAFMEVIDAMIQNHRWASAVHYIQKWMPELLTPEMFRDIASKVGSDEMRFEVFEAGKLNDDATQLWESWTATQDPKQSPEKGDKSNNELSVAGLLYRAGRCFATLGNTNGVKSVAQFYENRGNFGQALSLYQGINHEPPAEFYRLAAERSRGNDMDSAVKYHEMYLALKDAQDKPGRSPLRSV